MAPKEEPPDLTDPSFSYETAPHLFLFTSLTAGSSHIITATSRMETILKANRVPYYAIDTATDERARRIWTRRSKGRTIPGLVKQGLILADLEQVEEWNEFGELKEALGVKKKKKKATQDMDSSKTTAKENEAPKELRTGDAPPAPEMPAEGEKDLPIRTKPTESPAVDTQASAKPSGQSSLAAEVAAAAKKRAKDKATALKASVEAKRKEAAEAAEVAEEQGGTPAEAVVDDQMEAGPAGGIAEDGQSKVSGLDAVTDDPARLKKEEEQAAKAKQVEHDLVEPQGTSEIPDAANATAQGREIPAVNEEILPARDQVEQPLDAAPAVKTGEEAVHDSALNLRTAAEGQRPIPEPVKMGETLDAALASKSNEEATPKLSDDKALEVDNGAFAKHGNVQIEERHDSASSAEAPDVSKDEAVSSKEKDLSELPESSKAESIEQAVSAEPVEVSKTETEPATQSEGSNATVPADEATVKKIEKQNALPEEPKESKESERPKHGHEAKQEDSDSTKDSRKEIKEEALDAKKATESVED